MSQYSISVAGEAVAAATTEAIIRGIASASKAIDLVRWAVSFNGSTPTDQPVRVDLVRINSNGTSSVFTPVKMNPDDDAPLMTGRTAFTAEPTYGDILETFYVTPAGGLLLVPYGYDERIKVPASGGIGIRCLSVAAVNVSALMVFAE